MSNPPGRPHLPPYSNNNSSNNLDLNPSIHRRFSYASVAAGQSNLPYTSYTNNSSAFQTQHRPTYPPSLDSTNTGTWLSYHNHSHPHTQAAYSSRSAQTLAHWSQLHSQTSLGYTPLTSGPWGSTEGTRGARGEESSRLPGISNIAAGYTSISATENMRPDSSRSAFFVPSYMRGSRLAERLEATHKASLNAAREAGPSHSHSNSASLSRHPSSANLHKSSVSTYRGVATDVIERNPPQHSTTSLAHDDATTALPSRWSEIDKNPGLAVLGNGTELKFAGAAKTHDEAAAVRADNAMPPQCGIYYYEVTVMSKNKEGSISIGFSGPNVPLNRLPGWEPESWAYHGDDGMAFGSTASGKAYGPQYHTADVIGCGVNFRTGQAFFTKNGNFLGIAFHNIKAKQLFPAVGMKKPNEQLSVNFGQTPFVYDIDTMVAEERKRVQKELQATKVDQLVPPLNETQLIQRLVAQYLAHDGYVETARAFASEVRTEGTMLAKGNSAAVQDLEPEEDVHAVQRQKIRLSILSGNIDQALYLTEQHYPTVLKENENIYFRLRCRKFIEMIRRTSESSQTPTPTSTTLHIPSKNHASSLKQKSRRNSSTAYDDLYSNPMDVDDVSNGHSQDHNHNDQDSVADEMETSTTLPPPAAEADNMALLTETLAYGQELQSEFKDDPRREVKKALENTLALIAYTDPRDGPLRRLLDSSGRIPVAEELNGAILVSLGKSSSAALERLVQQTEVLLHELSADGGAGAFVNVSSYLR